VLAAAELILLRIAASIEPSDARELRRGKALEAGIVLVGDEVLFRFRDRFERRRLVPR
jgi:hypothetical protein